MSLHNKIVEYIHNSDNKIIEMDIQKYIIKISKDNISIYDKKKKFNKSEFNKIFKKTNHVCTYSPLHFGLEQICQSKVILNKLTYEEFIMNLSKIIQ